MRHGRRVSEIFAAALALCPVAVQAAGPHADVLRNPPSFVMRAAGGVPAAVDLGFAQGLFWPPSPVIAVTRASVAYEDDLAGNWYSFPTNTLRRTNRGALIEEARTNGVRNNTMVGAVVSGALPNNWSVVTTTGLTATVQAIGVVNGVNTIDLRVSGTASGGGNFSILFDTTTGIPALYGQTWAGSVFVAQIAGSMSNIGLIRTVISEYNSGGTSLATTNATIGTTAALTRFASTRTLVTATTAGVGLSVVPVISGAGAVDITLRIGWPQVENNNINAAVASATVANGGTLYVGNGTMTWSGAGCATNPVLNVTETAGIINAVTSVATAGSCATFPPAGATTWTPGGGLTTGSGASFNLVPVNNAAAAFATSPIPTTNAAVARAADVATMVLPAGATSAAGYSLLGIGTPEAPAVFSGNLTLAEINDGTLNNRVGLLRQINSGNPVSLTSISGVTTQIVPAGGPWAQNTQGKSVAFVVPNSLKATFNGGAVSTGALTGLAAVSKLSIGLNANISVSFDGYISRIVVAPASLLNN